MSNIINLLDSCKINIDKKSNSQYTYNGIIVPRVTEIISKCIHSDYLMYWANSLGFKHQSYNKTLSMAADIGSQCHESIDLFIENDSKYDAPYNMNSQSRYAYESYLKWWNDININNNVKVLYHEYPLICKYFGGTMDGLYEINGKKYIVDYKTSNHVTFRYFLQVAAYRYILKNELGIDVDGCIILQLSKNDISYNEYVLNFCIPEHLKYINDCELAFLSMVFSYYNINNIENEFNNIAWGNDSASSI